MGKTKIPYIIRGYSSIVKLNPTGRWKIDYGPYCIHGPVMYIEHKGRFLKKWIYEEDVVFRSSEIFEYINGCKNVN